MNRLTALGIAHEFYVNGKKVVACVPDYWDTFDMVKSYLTTWHGGDRYRYQKLYGSAVIRRDSGKPSIHFMPDIHSLRGMHADLLYVEGSRTDEDKMMIAFMKACGAEVIYA